MTSDGDSPTTSSGEKAKRDSDTMDESKVKQDPPASSVVLLTQGNQETPTNNGPTTPPTREAATQNARIVTVSQKKRKTRPNDTPAPKESAEPNDKPNKEPDGTLAHGNQAVLAPDNESVEPNKEPDGTLAHGIEKQNANLKTKYTRTQNINCLRRIPTGAT